MINISEVKLWVQEKLLITLGEKCQNVISEVVTHPYNGMRLKNTWREKSYQF